MAKAAFLLVPSLWFENAPLVIRQAIESSLPVLASDIGGLAELVNDNITGRLIPPGEAAAWQATIEWALNNPAQVEKWRCGTSDLQATRYRADVLGPAYSELFGRIVGSSQRVEEWAR